MGPTDDTPAAPDVPPGQLRLSIDTTTVVTAVTAAGELDTVTAPDLQLALNEALGHARRHLLLDLAKITFISSAGINVLVNVHRTSAEVPVTLHLIASRMVARTLDLLGLNELFVVHATRAAAVAALTTDPEPSS